MEVLPEDTSRQLLAKEWSVKIDTINSKPYLIKFTSVVADGSCTAVLTDTKSVWAEVLSSQQFARRWRECNGLPIASTASFTEEEEKWRSLKLQVLTNAHLPGCIADCSFEVAETKFSDMAFMIEGSSFQWRWETCFIGYKTSAEFLSKHLILPLISLNYLAFSHNVNVNEMSDADIETAVDKVGRASRRNTDIHVRNVISQPRISSALSRLTAMFNFCPDLPAIKSSHDIPEAEALPSIQPANMDIKMRSPPPEGSKPSSTSNLLNAPADGSSSQKARTSTPSPALAEKFTKTFPSQEGSGSDTEDTDEEDVKGKAKATPSPMPPSQVAKPLSPAPSKKRSEPAPSSDTEDSPVRKPVPKRRPPVSSSDDGSDEAPRKAPAKRGTRQPIKRGGKKF